MIKRILIVQLIALSTVASASEDGPKPKVSKICQEMLRMSFRELGDADQRPILRAAAGAQPGDDVIVLNNVRELRPAETTPHERLDILRGVWESLRTGGRLLITSTSRDRSIFTELSRELDYLGLKFEPVDIPELKRIGLVIGPKPLDPRKMH